MGRSSSVWPWVLGGAAIAGAGLLARKLFMNNKMESMDDETPGSTDLPVKTGKLTVADNDKVAFITAAPQHKFGYIKLAPSGVLKLQIDNPKCRIRYDTNSWSGGSLASSFSNGEVVSYSKGNDIMRVQAIDGPPFWYEGSNRIKKPSKIYYRPYDDYAKVLLDIPLTALQVVGKVTSVLSANFQQVEYETTGTSNYMKLPLLAGKYLVIIDPSDVVLSEWSYYNGYWEWTRNGPRSKSCKTQIKQFTDTITKMNKSCGKKSSRFNRVAGYTDWDQCAFVVEVFADDTTKVTLKPTLDIQISNVEKKTTNFGKQLYSVCAGAKVVNWASKGALTKYLFPAVKGLLGFWDDC